MTRKRRANARVAGSFAETAVLPFFPRLAPLRNNGTARQHAGDRALRG